MTRNTVGRRTSPARLALAAMTLCSSAALAQPGTAGAPNGPLAAREAAVLPLPLRLEASVSERMLHVYVGDSLVTSYPVAVGKPQYPTPRGRFTIERVIWNPGWVPPDSKWARGKTAKAPGHPENPMKVAKLFFKEPDYYIHGTGAVGSLGSAASHGCLRMAPADVEALARLVMQHGGAARDEGWIADTLSSSRSREVRLAAPIVIEIGT